MSPASRRASPRSCVAITTLMPRAATARTMSSTALVAAGSRLAVGSSRNSTSGSRAERAGQRQPLLLAARQPPRRPRRQVRKPDQREQLGDPRVVPLARNVRGAGQRIADVGGGAAAQHHRALEHDGAPDRRHVGDAAPGHAAARSARSRPMATRSSVVLPAPFGPISTVGAPGAIVKRHAVEDRHRAARRRSRPRSGSADRRAARASLSPPAVRRRGARVQASALTTMTMAISTMPSPIASGRSPLEVSSAIAVVMVRVKPSMLPPTMMMAPTSAAARPKPASSAVTRLKRASQISVATRRERADVHRGQLVAILHPQILDGLARQRGDDRRHQDGLRDHHRRGREQQAQASRAARSATAAGRPRARPRPAAGPSAR